MCSVEEWNARRRDRYKNPQKYFSYYTSSGGSRNRQEQGLCQRLANQPASTRTQCGPNRQLPFSGDAARYQQTRDVGTRNEQHHKDSSKQDPSDQARTLHLPVAQGANLKVKILAKVRRYQRLRIGE
jgi:hypothetical protein